MSCLSSSSKKSRCMTWSAPWIVTWSNLTRAAASAAAEATPAAGPSCPSGFRTKGSGGNQAPHREADENEEGDFMGNDGDAYGFLPARRPQAKSAG